LGFLQLVAAVARLGLREALGVQAVAVETPTRLEVLGLPAKVLRAETEAEPMGSALFVRAAEAGLRLPERLQLSTQ